MKSLQESLFDNDLKTKELKFRDVYHMIPGHLGMQVSGVPLGNMFAPTKVIKYKNPYRPDDGFCNDFNAGILGIIVDMPVPNKNDFNKNRRSQWCIDLKSKLSEFIKPSWKQSFDEKFNVHLDNITFGKDEYAYVRFDYDNGAGVCKFSFKMK